MRRDHQITLKCDTVLRLADLEAAGLSYVPCGQFNNEDQPLFAYAHLWGSKEQITLNSFGRNAGEWLRGKMTGVQLMTGTPTYRAASPADYHLTDIDIERSLIDKHPAIVDQILDLYRTGCEGIPCIIGTKSEGLRLSAFSPYLGKKRAFKDEEGMLLEIFSEKGLSRLDGRYSMVEGSILDIPTLPETVLQDIQAVIRKVVPAAAVQPLEKPARSSTETRRVVSESQIGNLSLSWDSQGNSQYFSARYCPVTLHNTTRRTVRFKKHADESINGKCFNCGETWWEVPPPSDGSSLKKNHPISSLLRRVFGIGQQKSASSSGKS